MYVLTKHCRQQAETKFSIEAVLDAANNPSITYPSLNHPGQYRHVRGEVVAVVDPISKVVVTCYLNITQTDLRPDQIPAQRAARGKERSVA